MENESLVSITEFCSYHHLDIYFIQQLEQNGLIETTTIEQKIYLPSAQLGQLEKWVRLHQQLDIHADNLDVISNLLERMEGLQKEILQLKNRLIFYEQFEDSSR
jgi:hypothetical protein